MNKRTIIILLAMLAALIGYLMYAQSRPDPLELIEGQTEAVDSDTPMEPPSNSESGLALPISEAGTRITKKSYGTYVTPQNSPVSPEVFTGYHTGTDFEAFESEKDSDVVINAICSGELLRKTTASGYGGYAVQACTIQGQAVTVVYGHLRLSSIAMQVGKHIEAGQSIGVLGTGYSSETGNERKHLHLSIHLGANLDIRGYVQDKSALNSWIDPQTVLEL